jgi:hypothetical protein
MFRPNLLARVEKTNELSRHRIFRVGAVVFVFVAPVTGQAQVLFDGLTALGTWNDVVYGENGTRVLYRGQSVGAAITALLGNAGAQGFRNFDFAHRRPF